MTVQSSGAPDGADTRVDFYSLTRGELEEWLQRECGEPRFRARQLFQWVYWRRVTDVLQMSDLSRGLREQLAARLYFPQAAIDSRQISTDGTRKYLLRVEKDDRIECVFIKQPKRNTLCVSSQVGCAMGCRFCRTATMGLRRHLSPSEIVRQVLLAIDDAKEFGDAFENLVFMGMGEPLHNVENVIKALEIIRDASGLNISGRRITVSTSGLVPAIERFGAANLDVNLAVSLNATDDETREQVMPVNKRWNIAALLQALREFPMKPRRCITIEYVMLGGVNDRREDLVRLPKLLHGLRAKVNLIPYNMNAGLGFTTPSKERILEWQHALLSHGLSTTIRWSKGPDIDAACGQLATATSKVTKIRAERAYEAPSESTL